MKSLRTLLKISRRQLDTLRRALAAETARLEAAEARIRRHDDAVLREQELAKHDHEAAIAYVAFSVRARGERADLAAAHKTIELEIDRVRTLIAEAHVEMRRFERLLELEAAREKAALEKREDAELDELATLRSGRG